MLDGLMLFKTLHANLQVAGGGASGLVTFRGAGGGLIWSIAIAPRLPPKIASRVIDQQRTLMQ